jgi:predicted transcriptional regulator of viral defense system
MSKKMKKAKKVKKAKKTKKAKKAKKTTKTRKAAGSPTARKTARWAVVQELKRRKTARNVEIARALDLRPSTVGYILHQLRVTGCAKRIKTGVYTFVRMPKNLHFWDDGVKIDGRIPAPVGKTMPDKIINLLENAPRGALSFLAIWKLSRLERNVTGAVLSDLVNRGLVKRVRRGLYKPVKKASRSRK